MATSRSNSNHYNSRNAQPAHNGKFRHEKYEENNNNLVDQSSDVPDLKVIRSVKELLDDAVNHHNYTVIK